MAVRIFRCRDCGHKMRLSGAQCGNCFTDKELHQRITVVAIVLAALAAFGAGLALVI